MYAIERSVRFASYIPYTNKSIVHVYVWEKFWICIFENGQFRSTIKCFISIQVLEI